MQIPTSRGGRGRGKTLRRIAASLVVFLLLLIMLAGAFGAGMLNHEIMTDYFHPARMWANRFKRRVGNPARWVAASWRAQPQRLILDIKHQHYEKLVEKRADAMELGILHAAPDDYVSATLSYGDESVKVKVRLKGDWVDHLAGSKWSFRVKVRGDNTFMRMKRFSLQHPATRNYAHEWLFHRVLRREGLIGLRYKFVVLTVNGKDLGVYAMEEHFEKRLIEEQHRREGPIVRFNEDLFWAGTGQDVYHASHVDGFSIERSLRDESSRPAMVKAVSLLTAFQRGELDVAEVFDVPQLARYYALSDLLSAEHNIHYHNLRFYYNPVTSRLEPIGFDAQGWGVTDEILEHTQTKDPTRPFFTFNRRLFANPIFVAAYHRELRRVSQPSYLDALLEELQDDLDESLEILYTEFPGALFTTDYLRINQQNIRRTLDPPKLIHAWLGDAPAGDGSQATLRLANLCALTVEVSALVRDDGYETPIGPRVLLGRKTAKDPLEYHEIHIPRPPDTASAPPRVLARVLGLEKQHEVQVFVWAPVSAAALRSDTLRADANAESFDFVDVNHTDHTIDLLPGTWAVNRDLIFPAGFEVRAGPGVTLDLGAGVSIISRSPLRWRGDEISPVTIRSSQGQGQGLVVLGAQTTSILEHVNFENLASPQRQGWSLPGAVTFYESPAALHRCRFVANRSEDALNIIRGEVQLSNCDFVRTQADALDADFARGTIDHCRFIEAGNDAIDVSGSVFDVADVVIRRAGDKAISAGENSTLNLRRLRITDSEIAIASKDLSTVNLWESQIIDTTVGLVAYQKKPEFGPGTIAARGLEMRGIERTSLLEQGSAITIDGRAIPPGKDKVEEILYGALYGKKSD